MKKAIIHVTYDEAYLESEGTTIKDEVQGWLHDSNVTVISVEEKE